MQSKPKILVLKMRELIYTGIFLFLAIVLIVLLILNCISRWMLPSVSFPTILPPLRVCTI